MQGDFIFRFREYTNEVVAKCVDIIIGLVELFLVFEPGNFFEH